MMDKNIWDTLDKNWNEIYLLIEDLHERVKKLEEVINTNQSKEVRNG